MEFRQIVAYHGPNRWASVPTLEVLVELGSQSAWRSNAASPVVERLLAWLPALDDPPQQAPFTDEEVIRAESFHKQAARGLSLACVLERVTSVLETAAGTPPRHCHCTAIDAAGTFRLTLEFEEEALGRACLETARRCVLAVAVSASI